MTMDTARRCTHAGETPSRRGGLSRIEFQGATVRGRVLDKATVNGLTLVSIAGELDLSDGPLLRRALVADPAATLPDVALDMGDVDFMDCAVVGMLVTASRVVASAGGCLRLGELRPGPRRLVDLCELEQGANGTICVHETTTRAAEAPCPVHAPSPWIPPQATGAPAATAEVTAV
jgi:anti-anti-sigma factor